MLTPTSYIPENIDRYRQSGTVGSRRANKTGRLGSSPCRWLRSHRRLGKRCHLLLVKPRDRRWWVGSGQRFTHCH